MPASPVLGPDTATFIFETVTQLYAALDRVYKLAISLPDAPLVRFHAETAVLPRTTEAERLVIQRIGRVLPNYGWEGGGKTLVDAGAVMADDLSSRKARILLMLLLQNGVSDQKGLQAVFSK
jgi:hypothetical protein